MRFALLVVKAFLSGVTFLLLLAAFSGCILWTPIDNSPWTPSRLPVGELTVGVWLPAGLGAVRFDPADQQQLAALGINWIQWLQRATVDSLTVEELAMNFCRQTGMRLPVYYEPHGFSPYDKLHNWAARSSQPADFSDQVRQRVRSLRRQWAESPGFAGYLVGHEDYRKEFYPALRQVIEVLRQEDPQRPAFTVGAIGAYPARDRFLDAFFQEGGAPNVFQHEHYVFRGNTPLEGRQWRRQLAALAEGYEQVARDISGRYGRWHAIVQTHAESRDGESFYRPPTGAELRLQAGLALSRGASGIVYFLYSSGPEEVRDGEGRVIQRRFYEGLVDAQGAPTERYAAVQQLNEELQTLSPVLAGLYFHGAFAAEKASGNPLLRQGEHDLEFGLFGDGKEATHLLVVNRRTQGKRTVELELEHGEAFDAVTGKTLSSRAERVQVSLKAGGFRLLAVSPRGYGPFNSDK